MPVRSCCVYWSGNEEMWALHAVLAKVQPKPPYFSYIQSPSTFRWVFFFLILDFGLEECCEQNIHLLYP